MKNSLFSKIFSSGIQAVAVQVLGGIFFILISLYLPKSESGSIAWANTVALILVMALSFGLDQIVTRRIASSSRSDWAAPAYLFHAAILSIITFFILIICVELGGNDMMLGMRLTPWMFLVQSLIFTAGPLKFFLNAKQRFAPYAVIAIISNIVKLSVGIILLTTNKLSVTLALTTLIACAAFELVALLTYIIITKQFSFRFKWIAYKKLIKEALPQYISVLFDSSLARADLFLLGIISTDIITSEYNLAYRAYEISKLPLTIISPILLARYARLLATGDSLDTNAYNNTKSLYRLESYFAMLTPLVLNILWAPVLDNLFDKKFGTVNAPEFMILSVCIPIHFIINILWTLAFSARKYKQISKLIGTSAIINIILNLAFIPFLGGVGAAIAFLITTIFQLIGYYKITSKHIATFALTPLFVFASMAVISYFSVTYIGVNIWLQAILAVAIYTAIAFISNQLKKQHITDTLSFFKPSTT